MRSISTKLNKIFFADKESPDYDFKKPVLSMFVILIAAMLGDMFDVISDSEGYELYKNSPSQRYTWAYRIDSSCPDHYARWIHKGFDKLSVFFPVEYAGLWYGDFGDNRDSKNVIWCENYFSQNIVIGEIGVNQATPDFKDVQSNTTSGRAHIYWIGPTIIEVDIQLRDDLSGWKLKETIDHELGHGSGCAHSNDIQALMYKLLYMDKGYFHDDLSCFYELYGFTDVVADYKGNLFIPRAVKLDDGTQFQKVIISDFNVKSYEKVYE